MDKNLPKPLQTAGTVTAGKLLEEQAVTRGDSTALIFHQRNKSCTYSEFDHIARQVAEGLLASGITRGEHVAIWAPNLPEWLFVLFGCAKAGTTLVAVNTNYRAYELEYVFKQSDTTTLFLADGAGQPGEYLAAIYEICPELKTARPGQLKAGRLPELRNVIFLGEEKHPGMFSWNEFLNRGADVGAQALAEREKALGPGDVFTIMYTSGTTGVPKGAMLTHANFVINAFAAAGRQGLAPEDTVCIPLPFFHAYGCVAVLAAVAAGSVIAAVEQFRARDMLRIMESSRATAICGTPTMFVAALEELSKRPYDLSCLRGGNVSGAPSPPELVKAVVEKMGAREFGVLYGSTEAIISIMNHPDAALEHRAGTIGRAMPDVELKIIDPRTGQEVPAKMREE
jgi:fatty-acyl-CoA synthase